MPQDTSICPEFLATGSCSSVKNCTLEHDVPSCQPCGLAFAIERLYEYHLRSAAHQRVVSGTHSLRLRCGPCNIYMVGETVWRQHVQGKRHASKCRRQGVSAVTTPEETDGPPPGFQHCVTCDLTVRDADWSRHPTTNRHSARTRFAAHEAALEEAEKDKNGITVEGPTEFGIISPEHSGCNIMLSVKSLLPLSKTKLLRAEFSSAKRGNSSFSQSVSGGRANAFITIAQPVTVTVDFAQTHIGRYQDRLDLVFEDTQLRKEFIISRIILAIVGSKTDYEALRPRAPYRPAKRVKRDPEVHVEPGIKPPSLDAIPYKVPLPLARIPQRLAGMLSHGNGNNITANVKSSLLPRSLDSNTYARRSKYLLWIEEFQMERDLQTYDIEGAELTQHRSFHYLNVPGLAEKRPSVLVGDSILLQRKGAPSGSWFEGRVHVVRREEVGLRFSSNFQSVPGKVYSVRFKLNRYPLRRQHQALDTAFAEDRMLFPAGAHLPRGAVVEPQTARLRLNNTLIAGNPAQYQAVASIARLPAGSPPFVIFGPPGTGKTITVVESIRQVLAVNPQAKIIACAPSNSAADIIALRLQPGLSTRELFRFYAPSRHKDDVPHQLLNYTYQRSDGHFSIPSIAQFEQFRVVVTTCVSASVFYGIGIPRGHYSHIFIDEAGQATEAECMNSIMTMADSRTNVVLSGDPQQLGPIIRSRVAADLGLEVSFIERLMKTDVYDEHAAHGKTVVKLVKNFRSHQAILKFPNDHFYKGELERCADLKQTDAYLKSSHIPSPNFPVVFYAISGKDDREASSPSFFNIDEITQVKMCIRALRDDRKIRISDNDIGVITPYHAQCLKVRASLRAFADGVKVGSVEEFQGQERKVIIISTVRSSRDFVKYDLRHTLGFVANPRRFNVAVTRAQALLIVIGDPSVLSLDPLWRSFLNYVYLHGGWKGIPITWDPEEEVRQDGGYDREIREGAELDMNEFTRRMQDLTLEGAEGEDEEDGNIDREWRDAE